MVFVYFGTWLLEFLASVEDKYLLGRKKGTLYFIAESEVLLFTLLGLSNRGLFVYSLVLGGFCPNWEMAWFDFLNVL